MQVAIVLAGIILLVILISLKLHTLIALLISSIFTGLLAGMPFTKVMVSVNTGVGSTLGSVALIIALGAMYGKLIEDTGVAQKMVLVLSKSFKGKNIQWAVLATGLLVGIPLFYNAGFVILIPLVFTLAATLKIPVLYVGIPMATALSVTHGFLPPHPGPATLVGLFNANMGKTLLYGLGIGIPVAIACGILLTRLMIPYRIGTDKTKTVSVIDEGALPGTAKSFFIALLPVMLIGIGTIGMSLNNTPSIIFTWLQEPVLAFILALFAIMALLHLPLAKAAQICSEGCKSIALILLIIAAGGAFKQILIDSGTAAGIVNSAKSLQLSPIVFGWLLAMLLRLAIGSATIAALTASGIVLPLLKTGVSPELMVLSVGAGSLFGSHVNDTGFWMFKEYFGLSLKQTLRTWTVVESCISILGLAGVLLLNLIL